MTAMTPMPPRSLILPLVVAAVLFAARSSSGHELWLEPVDQEAAYLVHWGHSPAASHEGATSLEYAAEAVVEVRAFDADGHEREPATHAAEPSAPGEPTWPVRILAASGMNAVRLDAGTWTRTVRGTQRGGPELHPGGLGSWQAWASIKHITSWDERFARPVLAGVEISPLQDPRTLAPGDKIDLRVTLDGEPVEGAVVSYEGKPRGSTGPDGMVRIRLRIAGPQHLGAVFEQTHPGAAIARTVHEAFLEFEVEER